ncbi:MULTISPECIES: hypothetical protein [Pseudomonas]|uniref:Uncharacterized protein n=3 Tax=Pseudomonas TaxID=286 RepID=A0A1L7NP78_PSEPU|nr:MULTISPECIES: hypothetical protein [Pseudomonas]RJT91434.1 hypothetical protein D6T65_18585 [Arthrobacter frigidicola]HCF2574568.1 hypothetical protein [Pseudomonas aeruginosa]AGN82417.1 hypothetical protein L483_15905 [Pseudomonas putida H8234]ELS0926883.1 hypothetical protein [Pseudomonas putida]ENY78163.1 hypothetical protein C206_08509 [Pseudomonas putida TRO1]
MILTNERRKDAEDVGVLLHAIFSHAEANAEHLDRTLVAVGYATLLKLAESAAEQVAFLHDDSVEEWDGAIWYERLADVGSDSLAAGLFASDHPDVRAVVVKWLLSFGPVEFSHAGKRWSFDADELAEWEGEEEGFHFRAYHELAEPTIEAVSRFIDRL